MSILSIFFHPLNLKHTTEWQSLNLFSTWNFEKNAMTTTRKDQARRTSDEETHREVDRRKGRSEIHLESHN
jgi:hypothetical protein